MRQQRIIDVDALLQSGGIRPGEVLVIGSGRGYSIERILQNKAPAGVTPPFKVGDPVKLNKKGMVQMHGITSPEQFEDSQNLIVTGMSYMGGTDSDAVWCVDVNRISISQFLLTDDCFDRR